MKHEPIDPAAATALDAPIEPRFVEVQAALCAVASAIDSRFVAAGEALASAYAIVERLIASLEGMSRALGGGGAATAVADMHAIADRLTRLPATQQIRQAALITIGGAGAAFQPPLLRFDRTLRFLRICGLNIKVAAAGAAGFDGFADMMIDRLDVAEAEIHSFVAEIENVTRGVATALAAEQRLAQESVTVIPEVPLRLSRDARALQGEQDKASALASRIAEAALAIRSEISTAIGALQIGDITRQRLEHIVSGLGELGALGTRDADDPVILHTLALLAAQAADTTDDFQRQAGMLAQTLRDVGPHATALIALTGDRRPARPGASGGESTIGPLEVLEQSIDEVRTLAGRLHETDALSYRIGDTTRSTAEALGQRLVVIQRVTVDVQQMAWNTDLHGARLGNAGRGLGAVASEIRNFSLELERASADIGTVGETISSAAAAMHGADAGGAPIDVGHALDVSLSCVREAARSVRDGLSDLDRDAVALSDFLRRTMGDADGVAEFGAPLAAASDQLSSLTAGIGTLDDAPAELVEILARIAATYTMAREREVHKGAAPTVCVAEDLDPAAIEDDEDDGLF
jgi:hypothetical protein